MSGFHIVISNRTERLVLDLAEQLAIPRGSALAPETILIQGRGMERYLALRLADRLGIAANLSFPYPGRFIDDLFGLVIGADAVQGSDLRRLSFRLVTLIREELNRKEFAQVRDYVVSGDDLRLFRFARQVADVFDQYAVHRPDLLALWAAGNLDQLQEGDLWQALLWRRLSEVQPLSDPLAGVAQLREKLKDRELCARVLPARLFLFGVSTVRGLHRRILAEIGRACDVYVYCLSSSRDSADGKAHLSESRLSATGAEFRTFLEREAGQHGGSVRSLFEEPPATTALGRLQQRMLTGTSADSVHALDSSVRLASCHTPYREVEVLRDHLLDAFARRSELTPSDVLVLTPNIREYAPLVEAVFGNPENAATRIPFHVADSRPGEGADLIAALTATFDVALGRTTARQLLQLLEEGPVARHFRLEEAELEWVRIWIREVGIRWGWDADDRATHGLPPFAEGSWQLGLDRMLLGLTFPPGHEEPFGAIMPFTDIEGDGVEVLGRLADLVRCLFELSAGLKQERTAGEWASFARTTLATFTGAEVEDAPALRELFQAWNDAFLNLGLTGTFDGRAFVAQVRDLPLEVSAGKGFASGGVLFAALLPMRAVPYRVVCLLGMNEDAFPGTDVVPEFHLLYRTFDPALPHRRTDDRLLFLETLLSARDELYISYIGQDMYTNRERQPSVVVAEIRDAIVAAEGWSTEQFVRKHRLQAFSQAYFSGDPDDVLFSYSARNRSAAVAARLGRTEPPPFFTEALPLEESDTSVLLDDLIEFYRAPGRFFLYRRFGFRPRSLSEAPADEEDILPNALGRWHVLEFLLEQLLAGRGPEELLRASRARGLLSPGAVGLLAFERELGRARIFAAQMETALPAQRPKFLSGVVAAGNFTVTGRVLVSQQGILVQRGGDLRGPDFLGAWLRHLFLQLLPTPLEGERTTTLVGRKRGSLQLDVVRFAAIDPRDAERLLADLVELYQQGLTEPLPLLPRSSFAYFEERLISGDESALRAARKLYYAQQNAFSGGFAEEDEPWISLCFRGRDPLDGDAAAFTQTAVRVYAPLSERRETVPVDWEASIVSGYT